MTLTSTRLRGLDAAATPGPWSDDATDPGDVVLWGPRDGGDDRFLANVGAEQVSRVGVAFDIDAANAALIVAMRNDLPRILAALELLEAVERLEDERVVTIVGYGRRNADGDRWSAHRAHVNDERAPTLAALLLALGRP